MERTACANCGEVAAADAKYCARCGSRVDGVIAAEKPSPQHPFGPTPPLTDPLAAFFIYLLPIIGAVAALVLSPYKERPILRFHAWQSIFFSVLYVGLNIAVAILTIPFTLIGLPLGAGVIFLMNLGFFLGWIYLLFRSVTGESARLPYLAELADEQAQKK